MKARFKVMKVACTDIADSPSREVRMSPVSAAKDNLNSVFADQGSPNGEIFLIVGADQVAKEFVVGAEYIVDITAA